MMISGWKQTGKDFLFTKIKNNDLSGIFWVSQTKTGVPDFATNRKNIVRYAFADEVKLEIPNYEEYRKVFFRNQCIEHAEKMKLSVSESYWADKVTNKINANEYFIITDFRFPVEYISVKKMFPSVVTARVFRSCVEIPSHSTEHQLNNWDFDYFIFFNIKDVSDFLSQNINFKLVF